MALSLKDLTTPPTQTEIEDVILVALLAAGFPITQWQTTGVARTLIKAVAKGTVSLANLIAKIAQAGFNSTATRDLLTLLAHEVYANDRYPATFATMGVTLRVTSALAGPYTILPSQLWAKWGRRRYRNTTGGDLTFGGLDLDLTFIAESPGAGYNAPPNLLELTTELAGVEVVSSIVTVQGADEETDTALRLRDATKWGSVGSAANDLGYEYWARTASSSVTRVRVYEHTPVDGDVRVVLGGPSGAPDAGVVSTVQTYLEGVRALCVTVEAVAATPQNVVVGGTLYVKASHPNAPLAKAQAEGNLSAYLATLPLGGTAELGDLYSACTTVAGVENAILDLTANVVLGANSVPVFVSTLAVSYV
jgi:phage-related baseplate assembly protein